MDTTAMMDINFMSNTSEIKAIYTVLILVCLSLCLSFCLWLPANFWVVENVEECQDFIWWIMKKNGRESSRLLIKFKVNLNTKIKLVTVIGVDILWTYCNLFLIRKFCCVLFISTQKLWNLRTVRIYNIEI